MPGAVEEQTAVAAQTRQLPACALGNRRFHRLGGGTFRTAPFRTPGNKPRPGPLDDLRNSLLTTFFRFRCRHSALLGYRILIGPLS
jgi:hypothetical protein